MTDIHTHILPGLDDGAQGLYDTLEMAAMAFENGTTRIVATPHCNIPGMYDNYFGERYIQAFERARKAIEQEKIPVELLPGMEVFATEDVPELLAAGKIMPLNQTRNVLIEFDFAEDPWFAERLLRRVREVGARPVIAHARNRTLDSDFGRTRRQRSVMYGVYRKVLEQRDPSTLMPLISYCLTQVKTNMSVTEIYEMATEVLAVDNLKTQQAAVPQEGTYNSIDYEGMAVLEIDLEANKQYINELLY